MRLNIEDEDFGSYKIRMASAMFDESGVSVSSEHTVLGLLSRMWYHAINDMKREITTKDLSRYLLIPGKVQIAQIRDIFVDCGYLEKISEDLFVVTGKEKDYVQKGSCNSRTLKAREAKKIPNSVDSTVEDEKVSVDSTVHNTVHNTVHSTVDNTVDNSVDSTVKLSDSSVDKIPFIHSYIHTEHTEHTSIQSPEKNEKPEIIPSPPAQVEKNKIPKLVDEKPTQILKNKYFDLYAFHYGVPPSIWGMKENTHAKRLLSSISLERAIELLEFFFNWNNKEAIDGGHSFCTGYRCFMLKLDELQADILKPERRISSAVSSLKMKNMAKEKKIAMDNQVIIDRIKAEHEGRSYGH